MSALNVVRSIPPRLLATTKAIIQIHIDHWALTSHWPAFTWGAGPCLNVVIHEASQNQGILAHLSNMVLGAGGWGQRADLYCKVKRLLDVATARMKGSLEIFLGAGHEFFGPTQIEGQEFADLTYVVSQHLAPRPHVIHDCRTLPPLRGMHSSEWNPGDVMYAPQEASVFIISTSRQTAKESGLRFLQNLPHAPIAPTAYAFVV